MRFYRPESINRRRAQVDSPSETCGDSKSGQYLEGWCCKNFWAQRLGIMSGLERSLGGYECEEEVEKEGLCMKVDDCNGHGVGEGGC